MTQVTEPTSTARNQKDIERTRSITAPETIEAAVHENSRKAAQKTPLMRAQPMVSSPVSAAVAGLPPMCGPMSSLHGSAQGAATSPPVMPGPLGRAK